MLRHAASRLLDLNQVISALPVGIVPKPPLWKNATPNRYSEFTQPTERGQECLYTSTQID